MSVRVLAFFDTRYQNSADIRQTNGEGDPWRRLRDARPASRRHFVLNLPSTLGQYDLASPGVAGQVVEMARQTGIDGFVVDIRWSAAAGAYLTGAEVLSAACDDSFGLAYRWCNGEDNFWKSPASHKDRRERAAALIRTLRIDTSVRANGRVLLLVDDPNELADSSDVFSILQDEARCSGLKGLYCIANHSGERGHLLSVGYDALLDPSPSEWHSCQPQNRQNGLTFLEVMAGLKDSVEYFDKFFPYAVFALSRMVDRERRGRAFPRVFPAYHNWASHPDGGATLLTAGEFQPFDAYLYGLFVENAMLFSRRNFAPDERLVFLESWNGWLTGSQVEPSLLDGDLIINTTRSAIDRARYVIKSLQDSSSEQLEQAVKDRIALLIEASENASKPVKE